jgi:hypothetical protein
MRRTVVVLALLLAIGIVAGMMGNELSLALWPRDSLAQEVGQTQELSPGRVRKNLGERPANVPGFDKVRVVEDTAQPGATWSGTMRHPMFCTLLQGEITTMMDGMKVKRKAGDSWECQVGQKMDSKSTGSADSPGFSGKIPSR